jgi:hypothetical protein
MIHILRDGGGGKATLFLDMNYLIWNKKGGFSTV